MSTFVRFCKYMAWSIGFLITSAITGVVLEWFLGDWVPLLGLSVLSVICYLAASAHELSKKKGEE